MTPHQSPNVDLRRRYPVYFEIGLAVSLGLVLALFLLPIQSSDEFEIIAEKQEVVFVQEIEQTRQIERVPPPPAAPAPIEVPNDVEVQEQVLNLDMDLDLSERVVAPPPPPRPAAPPPEPEREPEHEPEPEIFVIVEEPPELIGGLDALQARVRYPELARLAGIEGTVFVQFVVDENGNVTAATCVREPGGGLCEAALEAVREAKFKPGRQRGRAVKVRFSLPIRFRLR